MGALKDLGQYLTRPIIPFCFGLPLLLPATLLVVIAFLQDHISLTLHVLGFFLLSLAVLAICCGVVLGFHDVWRSHKASKRPTTKGFQRFNQHKKKAPKRHRNGTPKNCVSPTLTISVPNSTSSSKNSSRNSSRRSSRSDGSLNSNLVVVNEMVRLVSNSPARKTRRLLNRPNVRTPKMPMPSLEEEDHTNASLSDSGVSRSNSNTDSDPREGLRSGKAARDLKNLEQHLREIGLGASVPGSVSQSVDVELLSMSVSRQKTDSYMEVKREKRFGHFRSRSMPEKDLSAFLGQPDSPRGTGVPGSAREEELLRKSARASRSRSPQPMLTNESCERVGVRMDMTINIT